MPNGFDDAATLKNVNAIGMHHRRQAMHNQNRDTSRTSPFRASSRLISSSVSECERDVASSNTEVRAPTKAHARSRGAAFSPPETFTPPSPIAVSRSLSAREKQDIRCRLVQHLEAFVVALRLDERREESRGSNPRRAEHPSSRGRCARGSTSRSRCAAVEIIVEDVALPSADTARRAVSRGGLPATDGPTKRHPCHHA